jgi:hypothetical protein
MVSIPFSRYRLYQLWARYIYRMLLKFS